MMSLSPREFSSGAASLGYGKDLLASGVVVAIRLEGTDRLLIDTVDVHRFRRLVAVVAARQDAHLLEVTPLDDDLDSVFRYLVGR